MRTTRDDKGENDLETSLRSGENLSHFLSRLWLQCRFLAARRANRPIRKRPIWWASRIQENRRVLSQCHLIVPYWGPATRRNGCRRYTTSALKAAVAHVGKHVLVNTCIRVARLPLKSKPHANHSREGGGGSGSVAGVRRFSWKPCAKALEKDADTAALTH